MTNIALSWKLLLMTGPMLAFAGVPLAVGGQTKGETDRQAIVAVIDRFVDAWNRHDAKAFAAVFAEDADFTNWRGTGASGRSKIEEFHAPLFATIFKNSHQSYTTIKTQVHPSRRCSRGCALGDDGCDGCPGKPATRSSRIVEFRDGKE
jgi:ketosteroid isomerase-like protein